MLPATSQTAISLTGVYKRFPGVNGQLLTVLEKINLEVASGEFVSLVGASGCGKTTLLKMMSGLVSTEEGTIVLQGKRVQGIPHNIGFVFQEPGLLPWLTVAQNVDLAIRQKRLSKGERRTIIDRYLAVTGLTDFAGYPPYKLSGGMQQRVGLARALAVDPQVLLMDEPFGALDALTRAGLQQELARIVSDVGTTVLFVTHDVDEAIFLSDRIAVMSTRPGRIREVVPVPGSRPRARESFRLDPAVQELRTEILRLIEGVV